MTATPLLTAPEVPDQDGSEHAASNALHLVRTADLLTPRRRRVVRPQDSLLPIGLVLWVIGVHGTNPAAMNEYGLLAALPVTFYVGLGFIVASIAITLTDARLSPVRLALHLGALIFVLHGTVPLVIAQPSYPWLYKHVGVTQYIDLHGSVDPGVDIYQNWPGFFALAAWLTRISGGHDPLAYAGWAPVYFNLLTCIELAFVFRCLPSSRRARWIALFLFVAANWVGQDYFAPQALAFVLSLAVFGMLLAWFQADRPVALIRVLHRLGARVARGTANPPPDERSPARRSISRLAAFVMLFATFAVLVPTHQLSPYVVVLSAGVLTTAGLVRPRWVVIALAIIAVGYLLLRLPYIQSRQDLFGSLGDPFGNISNGTPSDSVPKFGRRLTALAAPALILGMWMLAALGVARRVRTRRPLIVPLFLAVSPALIAVGQSYGGEAVFRIYLFSLPWVALLGAYWLEPGGRRRHVPTVKIGVVVAVTVTLFMSAFWGAEALYQVRPGEVEASQFFYDNAEPGSAVTLAAPNFPTRVAGNYDRFASAGDNPPAFLVGVDDLRHRMLGPDDLDEVEAFVAEHVGGDTSRGYLALSTGQRVYSEVMGLLPEGSLDGLDRALDESPAWDLFYRNEDAAIYRLTPDSGRDDVGAWSPPEGSGPGRGRTESGGTVDWAVLGTGFLGAGWVGVNVRRFRRQRRRIDGPAGDKETTMRSTSTNPEISPAELPDPIPTACSSDDLGALVHQAVANGDDRAALTDALARREPEPSRVFELVAGVPVDKQTNAIRLLGEAWGKMPSSQLAPLLADQSGTVRAAAVELVDHSPDDLELLHRMLREDLSPDVRIAAVRAMTEAPEQEQLRALKAALADPHPGVRAMAAGCLPTSGATRATNLLFTALDDPDEDVRRAACTRLATAPSWVVWTAMERTNQGVASTLEEVVGRDTLAALALERVFSPHPGDRLLAIDIAGRIGTADCVAVLIEALADPESAVRRAAVVQLTGRMQALKPLVTVMHDDPDASVRLAAAVALDSLEHDDAQVALIAALSDPAVEIRERAVQFLAARPSPGLARRLVAVLTPMNVPWVGDVLVRLGSVGEEVLAAALTEGPQETAAAARELIQRMNHPGRFLADLQALEAPTRLRAVSALGVLRAPSVLDGLLSALTDSSPAVRAEAAQHLGAMVDSRAYGALRRVVDTDQSPEVVQAALQAAIALEQGMANGRLAVTRADEGL